MRVDVSLILPLIVSLFFTLIIPVLLTCYIGYRNKKRYDNFILENEEEKTNDLAYLKKELNGLKKYTDEINKRNNDKQN